MSAAWYGPLLAGALAALISFIEIYNSRGAVPPRSVFKPVCARLITDFAMGAAVYPFALKAIPVNPVNLWWVASLTAAISGQILLRTQFNVVGRGGKIHGIGLEFLYKKLREAVDNKINRQATTEDSSWVSSVAAPAIANIPTDQLRQYLDGYFLLLAARTGTEMKVETAYLKKLWEQAKKGEPLVHQALIFQLLAYKQRELVEALVKLGKDIESTRSEQVLEFPSGVLQSETPYNSEAQAGNSQVSKRTV